MENLNRIKGALADAGKNRRLACRSVREGSRNSFQVVYKHHTTRFANAGKDFGITKH